MFKYDQILIEGKEFYAYRVELPKTTLLVVGNEIGYFMCAALNVEVFDSKPHLIARKVVCGNASGVKTIDELINAPLTRVTLAAKELGIFEGMIVKDALLLLRKNE